MRQRVKVVSAGLGALAMACAVVAVAPLSAQQGPGARGGVGPRAERPGAMGGAHGAGIEAMLRNRATLGLTEEQVASLRALEDEMGAEMAEMRLEMREEMRAMREDLLQESRELAEQRRQLREERMERMRPQIERMKELRESHRDRIREVLSEEQQQKLEALQRQGRRGRGEGSMRPGAHRPGSGGPASRSGGRRGPGGGGF